MKGISLVAFVSGTPAWQLVLYFCLLIAFVVLLARILSIRLAGTYPALTTWLAVNALFCLIPWIVPMDWLAYFWFYLITESIELLLYLATVLELYSKVLAGLPGVASTARVFIQVVVPVSAAVGGALLALARRPVSYLDWFYRIDGTAMTTLMLFVLLITAFLVWFPVSVSRNTAVYSIGYAIYMVPKAASLFMVNAGHAGAWVVGAVGMPVSTLCLLFWAANLRRLGEARMVSPGSFFHPNDEIRLVAQLEAVNRVLVRAAKKAAAAE